MGGGATTELGAPLPLMTPWAVVGDVFLPALLSSSSESGPLESSDELLEEEEDEEDSRLVGEGLEGMTCLGAAEGGNKPGEVEGV